jgi:hypothetical protein
MQPMGGPQMGPMGPMGPMGLRQPIRQGTSKVVPIVVSAGLAVGVFCGLLFGLGTNKRVSAEPSKASNGVKRTEDAPVDVPTISSNTVKPLTPLPKAGSAGAATGSGSTAGSAASAPGSAAPQPGTLAIDIKPDAVAATAKILVDGKPVARGEKAEIPFEPGINEKKVTVMVQAPGYPDVTREETVEVGGSTKIEVELTKGGRQPATAGGTGAGGAGAGGTGAGSGSPASVGGDGGSKGDSGSKSDGGGKGDGGSKSGTGNKGGSGKGKGKKNGLIDI